MALLSNINDKFAVDSTGAIQFNGQVGTSGYVLKSNANAAPTWVDPSTVIGGPYLPLSGGTLTGNLTISGSNSLTVGGTLTGTTATFTGDVIISRTGGNDAKLNLLTDGAGGSESLIYFSDSTDGAGRIRYDHNDGSPDEMSFYTASTKRFYINGTGNATFTGNVQVTGAFKDSSGDAGTSGQILSSTATGTNWIDNDTGDISGSGVAGEVAYFTGTKTIANNAGMSFSNQQIQFDGIGGADGYILPYDQNPGYSNMAAGGFGLLFRESYDSYVTNNTYYYKTGGTAQWRAKYTAFGASVLTMLDGKFNFDTAPANTTSPYNLSLSTKMTILEGGNVGIGTTAPEGKLDVTGNIWLNSDNANAAYYLRINRGQSQDGGILLYGNKVLDWQLVNLANRDLNWYSYGVSSSVMRLTSAGNLGIGTTSPSKKLDVAGDFKLDGISGGHFENYAYGTQLNISELTTGGWARANRIITSDSGGDVFYGVFGANTTVSYAYWNIGDGSNNATNYSNANGVFLTRAGNVGIGVISPGHALDVSGNIRLQGGNRKLIYNNGLVETSLDQVSGSTAGLFTLGNVGIGTTTPFATPSNNTGLNVDTGGHSSILIGDGVNDGGMIQSSDNSQRIIIGANVYDSPTGSWQRFTADSAALVDVYGEGSSAFISFNVDSGTNGFPTNRMHITNTGNVGIGTTSPDQKLQVNGSIKISNSNSRLVFGTAGGTDRRALEGNTAGTLLQVGEGYSLTQIQSDTQVTGKTTTGEGIMVGGSSGYQIPVAYSIGNGSTTSGAIKIQLPQAMTNTMMMFKVRVYEYNTFEPFDITICGYNYQPTSTWYNVSAWIDSNANSDRNFTVRLGYDATATRAVAYIGELNAVWSYPQVWVTEWNGGYSNSGANWHYNYQISFETSAFTGITQTITNTQINNWARAGQNLYYGSGSGNVGIGNTSPQTTLHTGPTTTITNVFTARFAASNFFASGGNSMFYVPDTAANIMMFGSNQLGTNQIEFYHKNPGTSQSYVGRISTSGSATSYVTSSDYRLKENIVPISDSISRLNQLKPSRFNFIEEPNKTVDGFIAHEVQNIVPEAIVGEKDGVDENGGIIPQGIDQAKLVPLLVAAVQELEARVKELENK